MTTAAEPTAPDRTGDAPPTDVDVLIVGGGFSGLGMAIRLKQEGMEDFVVLERGEEVGGTWWFNTYPGCGCDVPSHLYSYSFAPKPDWSQTYSLQPEIRDYLRDTADEFGVRPQIRLGTNCTGGEWDEGAGRWNVETDGGRFRARVLVAGTGVLAEPNYPDIPGLDRFEGKTMHSARWDHDHDLKGERVASIGTGASAIQYVPAIQPEVEQLHVFQRTPPWVFPHTNRRVTKIEHRLYKAFPALQRLMRGGIYVAREIAVLGFVKNPRLMGIAERMAKRHMDKQISDPELREKVTPDYTIGCKRILPTDQWYPALGKPNVDLVTGAVREVRERSIVAEDGTEREVDTIIFGTGFSVIEMPVAKLIRGREGKLLHEHWNGSPWAYLGTAISGFPNFFMLLGPNTGLGHTSMVYMAESQIAYVMDALREMKGARTIEVRPEVEQAFNERIDQRMEHTVWNTGCASWYLDDTGRNPTLWPDWTFRFRHRTSKFDADHYRLDTTSGKPVAA